MYQKKSKWFIGVIVVLFAFTVGAKCSGNTSAINGGLFKNSSNNEFHWPLYSFPIKIHINNKASTEYKNKLKEAILIWNETLGEEVFAYNETWEFSNEVLGFSVEGVVGVDVGELGYNKLGRIRGRTEIVLYGGTKGVDAEIRSAHMVIDNELTGKKLRNVFVHELGHVLGLEHDMDKTSIMYYSSNDNPNQSIKEDDITKIIRINKIHYIRIQI